MCSQRNWGGHLSSTAMNEDIILTAKRNLSTSQSSTSELCTVMVEQIYRKTIASRFKQELLLSRRPTMCVSFSEFTLESFYSGFFNIMIGLRKNVHGCFPKMRQLQYFIWLYTTDLECFSFSALLLEYIQIAPTSEKDQYSSCSVTK